MTASQPSARMAAGVVVLVCLCAALGGAFSGPDARLRAAEVQVAALGARFEAMEQQVGQLQASLHRAALRGALPPTEGQEAAPPPPVKSLGVPANHAISAAKVPTPQPQAPGQALPVCRTAEEALRDGRIAAVAAEDHVPAVEQEKGHSAKWVPKGCRLPVYNASETARCYGQKHVLVFGDSISRRVFFEILQENQFLALQDPEFNQGVRKGDFHARFFPDLNAFQKAGLALEGVGASGQAQWVRSVAVNEHPDNIRKGDVQRFREYVNDIKKADVVIVNNAMWDMGIRFCGIKPWYWALKWHLQQVKAHMKPGASLALWGLHWLVWNKNSHKQFVSCNSQGKAAAFREGLQMMAACLGIPVIDTAPLGRAAEDFNKDGTHFNDTMTYIENTFVQNLYCRDPPLQLHAATECPAGWEDERLKELDGIADAQRGCDGSKAKCMPESPATRAAAKVWQRDRPEALKPDTAAPPECTTTDAVMDGAVSIVDDEVLWQPKTCRLKPAGPDDLGRCVARTRLVAITSDIYAHIFDALKKKVPYLHAASASHLPWGSYTMPPDSPLYEQGKGQWLWLRRAHLSDRHIDEIPWKEFMAATSDKARKEANGVQVHAADVILLDAGANEMMWTFCGVEALYEGVKNTLLDLKRRAKADARVIVLPPLWVHFDVQQYRDANYAKCMSPAKAGVFREAVRLAASCAGVPLLDFAPMTRQLPELTHGMRDGLLYRPPFDYFFMDVLTSVVCGTLRPEEPLPCAPDAEAAALARWKAVPEAQMGCSHAKDREKQKCTRKPDWS
eukprot:TRINITY_DN16817_c0_g1_i1.p1 TRINITY_DN16817_c0_g1~~TRINITY_DN16817_c0_g1_i1.p1  ORF type:complete len:790 (+),score=207.14 TRINITY_DN16817_c0_g1_i1:61-2430(+)